VSGGEGIWFLLNASPDLRQQIIQNRQLHPQHGGRHSPIAGAVLTNADVDHVAGLLTLRETQPLAVYATKRVHQVLAANSVFNVLNPDYVERRELTLDRPVELLSRDGTATGIEVEPFAVPGKVALYLEDPNAKNFGSTAEDTVALKVSARKNGAYFYYIPGCAAMPKELADRLTGAPLVLFDGTLWKDDEMIVNGVGVKTGGRMGHMSNSGPDGTIAAFAALDIQRKVFIHINNTNPILLPDTPERAEVEAAGWEVAYDGMELSL
jgi:pyrroloquinoline quinone biosynthesis protein B